jgi:hypothetical protein
VGVDEAGAKAGGGHRREGGEADHTNEALGEAGEEPDQANVISTA